MLPIIFLSGVFLFIKLVALLCFRMFAGKFNS